MIVLSETISEILRQPSVESFNLITVGTYYATDYVHDLTVDGHLFTADGKLMAVDAPRLSTVVDRAVYKASFADPSVIFGSYVDDGIVGVNFEVRVGLINSSGAPLTDLADTILAYKGKVDSAAYSNNMDTVGEVVLELTGASPVANLDMVSDFHTSKNFIKDINAADTCFDQIYEGSGAITLRWGKA
jgi:hypothetical protein